MVIQVYLLQRLYKSSPDANSGFFYGVLPVLNLISIHCMLGVEVDRMRQVAPIDTAVPDQWMGELEQTIRRLGVHRARHSAPATGYAKKCLVQAY